jgi:protein O-mannosyl-transferase
MSSIGLKQKRRSTRLRHPAQLRAPAKAMGPPRAMKLSPLWISVVLGAMTLAMYGRVIGHPFINYDDPDYVTANLQVREGLSGHTILWALSATEQSNWHPLTWISHALDYQLYGMDAAGHHLSSLLLHALNVILLFLLLGKVTGSPLRSAVVAAIFALHPLNVESVAWIAERKNVLSMFFFLAALGAYGWYVRRLDTKSYLALSVLFALALASKPMAITLPCVLLLIDYWPLRRIQGWTEPSPAFPVQQKPFSSLIREKVPLWGLSACSAIITVVAQQTGRSVVAVGHLPFPVRVENALYSYAKYVFNTFWPVNLAVLYPHPLNKLTFLPVAGSVLFLIVVSALAWKERFKRPYLVTGWLWFLGTLVPVLGLIQVGAQGMADRYAYLPAIGLFVMLVWTIEDWAHQRSFRPLALAVIWVPLLLAMAALSFRQLGYWHSSYDLWRHTLDVTEENFIADDNLGDLLLKQGRPEALEYFEAAARIAPWDPVSHGAVASSLQDRGDFPGAIREYEIVLRARPEPALAANAYASMGVIYRELGDYPKAHEFSERALNVDSDAVRERISKLSEFVGAHPAAPGYFQLGLMLEGAGQMPEAESAYEHALAFDAGFVPARRALQILRGN